MALTLCIISKKEVNYGSMIGSIIGLGFYNKKKTFAALLVCCLEMRIKTPKKPYE